MLGFKLATRGVAMEWAPYRIVINVAAPTPPAAKGTYCWLIRDGPHAKAWWESRERGPPGDRASCHGYFESDRNGEYKTHVRA